MKVQMRGNLLMVCWVKCYGQVPISVYTSYSSVVPGVTFLLGGHQEKHDHVQGVFQFTQIPTDNIKVLMWQTI